MESTKVLEDPVSIHLMMVSLNQFQANLASIGIFSLGYCCLIPNQTCAASAWLVVVKYQISPVTAAEYKREYTNDRRSIVVCSRPEKCIARHSLQMYELGAIQFEV